MGYTSVFYLCVFLIAAFACYTIVPVKHKWKVLLIFSYLFYFINSKKYIVFLLASTISVYIGGLMFNKIDDGFTLAKKGLAREEKKELKSLIAWQKKTVCVIVVLFNFGMLVFLKYFNFFSASAEAFFHTLHLDIQFPMHHLWLPLGISFYTMSAVSYLVDVYRGKYRACSQFGKVALFLAFFPHITEGPIGRFDLLGDQLYEGHSFDYERTAFGFQLILWGLFKKMVLADRANMLVKTIFDNYKEYSGIYVVVAVLLYTLQLYAEFSGCMDIVSGSAQLFGVTLSENFRQPFLSRSVSEFWRRWHITLGAWFRDYVFYTVSLSKTFMRFSKKVKEKLSPFLGGLFPAAVAMFVVWFGTGIWHGASWKYVAYGLYYYLIMLLGMLFEPVFRRFFEKTRMKREGKAVYVFRLVRTFLLVNIGMMLFRADTVKSFISMFISIFRNFSFAPLINGDILCVGLDIYDFLVLIVGVIILFMVGLYKEKGHDIRKELAETNLVFRWLVYYGLIFAVLIFGAYGSGYEAAGFIYAQF